MNKTIDMHAGWVAQMKRGDASAANHLYQAYSKAMYNTLFRICGNSDEAQDLLQDAFVKAFQGIEKYRGDSTFGTWLKRIVINTGLESIRKRKIEFEPIAEFHEPNWDEELPVTITAEKIHHAIKELPDGCRTVISLYLLENYSHQQIADVLSISISTSKTQYMRAKQLLKEKLTIYEND